jgi:hypothetical protein
MSGNYCEVCAGGGATLVGNEDASQYLCKECANEGTVDEPRDADAYGDDRGGEMGVTFGDD